MSEKTKISMEKLEAALQRADLIRINGVGPVFAGLLQEMGIHSAHDLLASPAQKTLESYQRLNNRTNRSLPNLGLKDIEYCQRFAGLLDQDIEW